MQILFLFIVKNFAHYTPVDAGSLHSLGLGQQPPQGSEHSIASKRGTVIGSATGSVAASKATSGPTPSGANFSDFGSTTAADLVRSITHTHTPQILTETAVMKTFLSFMQL